MIPDPAVKKTGSLFLSKEHKPLVFRTFCMDVELSDFSICLRFSLKSIKYVEGGV